MPYSSEQVWREIISPAITAMCTTATAKRRRKQAKLRNGRKINPMERRDRLAALRRKK